MDRKIIYTLLVLTMAGLGQAGQAQVATGGSYTLEQSVVANGGGASTGGTYAIVGTPGQSAAGTASASGQYNIRGGFWQGFLSPTAATVSISGRVTTADGRAVPRAIVTFSDASGTSRATITNGFGYYWIDGISAGQAYVVSITAKRLQFVPRLVMIQDSLSDLDLIMAG